MLAALLLALPGSGSAAAAPGEPDQSFGDDGRTTVEFGGDDRASHLALQPNGRIVLVGHTTAVGGGDFAIARLKPGGAPDSTFSGDGRQTIGFGGDDYGGDVALQPDGKIVVAGWGGEGDDMIVARLNRNGSIDRSFGNNGAANVNFGLTDRAFSLALQPDGKIVVVGSADVVDVSTDTPTPHFAVARLRPNGTRDRSFSGDGRQVVGFGDADLALAVALQPDGKIVVAGNGGVGNDMTLTRLNLNGAVDRGFGDNGAAYVDFGGIDETGDLAVMPGGDLMVVGKTTAVGGGDFAIARLDAAGKPVGSFDEDGRATVGFGGEDTGLGLGVQPDGKVIAMGVGGLRADFVLARLSRFGSLDQSFGTAGRSSIDAGGSEFDGDVAVNPNGRVTLAGSTDAGGDYEMAAARFLGGPAGPRKAPQTVFLSGPRGAVLTDRTPTLAFASSEWGSTFRCRIDRRPFRPCASPFTTGELGLGKHVIGIRAVDRIGLADSSTSKVSFIIARRFRAPECAGKPATVWRAPHVVSLPGLTLYGTEGSDVIVGSDSGRERIEALGGDDLVCGYGGPDLIRAGTGDDEVLGGESNDRLYGLDGDDRLLGGDGNDLLPGGDGQDDAYGSVGRDRVLGGDGNDVLEGNAGIDTLYGYAGLDFLWGDRHTAEDGGPVFAANHAGGDKLIGGDGPDGLDGGPFTDGCELQGGDLYRDSCEEIAFP
jgi:uncharacterized delta-60 repeat protein